MDTKKFRQNNIIQYNLTWLSWLIMKLSYLYTQTLYPDLPHERTIRRVQSTLCVDNKKDKILQFNMSKACEYIFHVRVVIKNILEFTLL